MRDAVLFPVKLIQAGGMGALLGSIIFITCLALGVTIFRILFNIANYVAVGRAEGVATVLSKRTIAAHREWQGKFIVNVPEQKVLNLMINDQNVPFAPAEWIYDRSNKNSLIHVIFRKGRLNGKIIVDRVVYL